MDNDRSQRLVADAYLVTRGFLTFTWPNSRAVHFHACIGSKASVELVLGVLHVRDPNHVRSTFRLSTAVSKQGLALSGYDPRNYYHKEICL